MAAAKRPQSNSMLYTLITFVGLFIVTTTVAIIFYVQNEEQKKLAAESVDQLNEFATTREVQKIGTIVGSKTSKQSYIGKLNEQFDKVAYLVLGGLPEDKSAELKIENVEQKYTQLLNDLEEEQLSIDPNLTGLIRINELLKAKLDNTQDTAASLEQDITNLQTLFDDNTKANFEKEQMLLAEKDKYEQQVNDIQTDYDELKQLLEKTSEQRVGVLLKDLDNERDKANQRDQDLLKTQAELKQAENRMQFALKQLQEIKPLPDKDVAAYAADGKIALVNPQTGVVHIDLGSDDRVYIGLTFAVYDKNLPIPKNGKPKAEIKIFDVKKNIAVANIIYSKIKNPVLTDDLIANLIWNTEKSNVFAVVGDFDIDYDSKIEPEGDEKIKELISKWGGIV
ncbi:MAG: hypothetical protein H8D47_01420, partial [Planctomycetes bacterium]|nr:hypothetical protein [Planctomycetota bacterium]